MQDTFSTAKTKLGRTKPSAGPHAGRGLDIADLDLTHTDGEIAYPETYP